MPDFGKVEDTLFVPMLGRIYASKRYPGILHDEKALSLEDKLPEDVRGKDTQTEYTLMASATRSINMDIAIKDFLTRNPDGVIINLGAGLETTFFRNDNGKTVWYEVDLPDVISYRRDLLGESEREILFPGSAFEEDWIRKVREDFPSSPLLVTASGLFHYFREKTVVKLLRTLKTYGKVEVVFDAVSSSGMKRMARYMKQVGHEDASMYFYVDDLGKLSSKIDARPISEEAYYKHVEKKGLKFMTRASMIVSDRFMMVKMEHLALNC